MNSSPSPTEPLLHPREGLPRLVTQPTELSQALDALARGTGPVAVDTERASGYTYSQRAYLLQFRRAGAGTVLIDPIAFHSQATAFEDLNAVLSDAEWIIHAASQDLPCLAELGLWPEHSLFDTELAGRLLNIPSVNLGAMTEAFLHRTLAKEHSRVNWSLRPLEADWLNYAALDVELLIELRDLLFAELAEMKKLELAQAEFEHLQQNRPDYFGNPAPPLRQRMPDPWRRTSGIHQLNGRRQQAIIRELWYAREKIAEGKDVAPGRILPDRSLIAAAKARPSSKSALLELRQFTGKGRHRYASQWWDALTRAYDLAEDALPGPPPRTDAPPHPRTWAEKNPAAAHRLALARTNITEYAHEIEVPHENLIIPDIVRRICWNPPATVTSETVYQQLLELSARAWQAEKVAPLLVEAFRLAELLGQPESYS